MNSQLKKLREENERLSSRVATLEAEKEKVSSRVATLETEKEKVSSPAEVSPPVVKSSEATSVFKTSGTFSRYSFNMKSLAKFIRNGIVGEIRSDGPKTHKYVLLNERREYLPDLVKQIIRDHILPDFENETEEEREKFIFGYDAKSMGISLGAFCALQGQLIRLEPTFISEVSKEVMKFV